MMDDPEYEMTTDISSAYHIQLRQDGSVWVESEGLVRLESLTAAGCCSLPPARPDDLGTLFGIPPAARVEPYAEMLTCQLSEHERTCSGNRTGFDPFVWSGRVARGFRRGGGERSCIIAEVGRHGNPDAP
jgi:hypothetical protein